MKKGQFDMLIDDLHVLLEPIPAVTLVQIVSCRSAVKSALEVGHGMDPDQVDPDLSCRN